MASILKVDTIQDQDGNNIINESANTITIGASGDTITIPSGATFASVGIDDNATSTAITIDSSERVGIGTTSPTSLLAVEGTSVIADFKSTNNNNVVRIKGNNATNGVAIGSTSSDDFVFTTNVSERMRIQNSTGNVGIGITSPASLLHISGTSPQMSFTETDQSDKQYRIGSFGSAYAVYDVQQGQYRYILDTNGNHIFNEGSQDCDFRVESNNNANMLFVDGGNDRVGIGTSSPTRKLEVSEAGTAYFRVADTTNSVNVDVISASSGGFIGTASSDPFIFQTANTERMRVDTSGNVLVGKTASMYFVDGVTLHSGGGQFSNTDDFEMIVNRNGSDGTLVEFRHATVLEGSISVSGTTVSYNGFTGTHWSRFTDNSTPTILKGTVLESLDEMCDWYNLEFDVTTTTQDKDGNDVTNTHTEKVPHVLADGQSDGDTVTYNHEGTDYQATIVKEADIKHMKSKVSDTVDAKNVYGVFVSYDNDGEGYNDFYVASVGSFVVRIKANETIAKGDLLQSNGDGTAKVQTDDAVRSSSFAKVLSTTVIETYDDGSFIVPCSLMC